MKLAITYDKSNNQIWQHFGHTEYFRIVTIDGTNVTADKIVGTNGVGHGALAGFLQEQGVEALICGGIGGGAVNALKSVGIELYAGNTGDADDVIVSFVTGTLQQNETANCSHHDHEHGEAHNCSSHSAGHSCGSSCH